MHRHLLVTTALAMGCIRVQSENISVLIPDTYQFESRAGDGTDSVAYDGQTARHLLVMALERHLTGLTTRLDTDFFPQPGDVRGELEFFFEFDSDTSGELPHGLSFSPPPLQQTWDDVSKGKNLVGKLAGNTAVTDHRDWSTSFTGWGAVGSTTPEQLVRDWFDLVDAQAVAWADGTPPLDPFGNPVANATITPDGHDLRQLLGKFLTVGVAFSQGADGYLDDDVPGKGLLADHSALVDGKPYTELEHQWDEGFGYFGASRDMGLRTLDEIADTPALDANDDGAIDLLSEVVYGHAGNAAKRDRGSKVASDLTTQAWDGFAGGRQLLAQTDGPLTDAEMDMLVRFRDDAVGAWEAAIAATALHYANKTLKELSKVGQESFSFAEYAKVWSELKGFALGLQFNRRSPMSQADFVTLHALIGDAPVSPAASAAALEGFAEDLRAARDLIAEAYDFDPANLGDENGFDGW
jgi:hypothetical protein